jgi:hypothetical protein
MSCQKHEPKIAEKNNKKTPSVLKTESSKFSGNFSGVHNEKEIYVTLNSSNSSNRITGILNLDGEQAKIHAIEKNGICLGKITENNSDKTYAITMKFIDKKIHFSISFPEYNNKVLALILDRNTLITNGDGNEISINMDGENVMNSDGSGSSSKKLNRDRGLIGKWRFTEVISSGSGQFYSSFSTDYFVQFDVNGDCFSWIGKSAGGSGDINFDTNDSSNVDKEQWHTVNKNVVFVNRNTNEEIAIPYFAEENRMILKGPINRVYQRVE